VRKKFLFWTVRYAQNAVMYFRVMAGMASMRTGARNMSTLCRTRSFGSHYALITGKQGGNEMTKGRDRTVYKRDDGKWVNKRHDADRASSLHETQREAEIAARDMLKNQGGGELITKGLDGRIRSKDTIAPGSDPNPPKDKEH